MSNHLILSNPQFMALLERLGYQPVVEEEVQYICGPDQTIQPVVITTLRITLPQKSLIKPFVPFSQLKSPIFFN